MEYKKGNTLFNSDTIGILIAIVVCLLLFLSIFIFTFNIPYTHSDTEVGARFFPFVGSVLGFIFTLLLIKDFISKYKIGHKFNAVVHSESIQSLIIIIAFVLLMPYVGFYLSCLLFVPAIMLVGGTRNIIALVLASLGFSAFTYFLFEVTLNISFPAGWHIV